VVVVIMVAVVVDERGTDGPSLLASVLQLFQALIQRRPCSAADVVRFDPGLIGDDLGPSRRLP